MRMINRATLLSTVAMGLAATATPALAQSDVSSANEQQEGGLNEILVTARKREESVQDVPVAVTALSAEVLERRDITSIERIAAATPNLNVGRASNGSSAQITLRGVGSSSTSIGIEQSVAVVVDGAYYGQGRVIEEGFFDLERVEVLKGPQALFFGKNATAGVISLTTKGPTDIWEGHVKAGYEFKAEQYVFEGAVGGPITDTLGIRLAVRYSDMDGGYYRNESVNRSYTTVDTAAGFGNPETLISTPVESPMPQQEVFLARGTLEFEPTSDLTMTVKVTHNRNDTLNNSWNYVAFQCGLPSGISQLTGFPCEEDFVTHQNNFPLEIAADADFAREDGALYNSYRSWAVNGGIEYVAGDVLINSVTNYQWNNNSWACACDFQTSDATPTWATEDATWEAFSQELRFTSDFDGIFNFMIGGLFQSTQRDFLQYGYYGGVRNTDAPRPGLVYAASEKISDTSGETLAIFGQVRVEFLENLELAVGGRYTDESKESFFSQPYVNPALTGIFRPGSDPLGTITADQSFSDFTPEVTLTYKPTPDLLIYGAYKTAYKSGGFSNGGINSGLSADPLSDLTFNPETASGFEAGVKATLADNQLRLGLNIFDYDYNDFQVDFFNSPIFAFQTLTADANTKGIELDFEFAPYAVPGLNITGSINYNDAKYDSFPLGPCYAGQTPAAGCSITVSAVDSRQDLSGAPLSVAPEWTGNLGVFYETDVSDNFRISFNGNVRYSDSYLASGFGNPLSKQDSYATLDAGFTFGAADRNWQLAVIGKNLTNEFYVTGVVDGPGTGSGTGTAAGVPADQLGFGTLPRTVMVEVTKRF